MLLPLPVNLFEDDCIRKLDLHRFRDYLFGNFTETCTSSVFPSSSSSSLLVDILMKEGLEGNEQDLEPFPPALLKPLQSLPPGKLPGLLLDPEAFKTTLPTSIFSSTSPATLIASIGNSPKRRKIDNNQQNITIQHF